ncbi:WD40 repeat-like protein [Coniophora puteana RWD-64-598 SS2]|uniref:WD40 repeat-like protein n=1 Tax=Coniophora puteana (strain RWD-64-598) TaxID=741705 RepID=A0A5M3N670_CONPW|nr:WD40 repeat-like protein [Coniophora puteana RWD-64-598 SS2]EIW86929.1 WD40 repeat-like protein [Coniophora puteana RWD-64-598 SS2]
MAPPILITADELNCLIHAYFVDSGYHHAAFSLKSEAHLDRTPHFKTHIQRGELVALLSKSLLYAEVEAHWKAGKMASDCKIPFTLLEPHVCSSEVSSVSEGASATNVVGNSIDEFSAISQEAKLKRKASTPPILSPDARNAKRPKEGEKRTMTIAERLARDALEFTSRQNAVSVNPHDVPCNYGPPILGGLISTAAIRTLKSHSSEVFIVAWNPVRVGHLVSGSRDAVVNSWDIPLLDKIDSGAAAEPILPTKKLLDLTHVVQADLTSFDWSADGKMVAVGSYDSVLRVFGPEGDPYITDGCHTVIISHPKLNIATLTVYQGPVFAAKFSPNMAWLVTASLDSTSVVYDVQGRNLLKRYRTHSGCCLDVEWIDNVTFASCGADHLVYITSLENPTFTHKLIGHTHEVNVIKCNPSKTKLASCSDDATARVWTINPLQKSSVELKGHQASLTSVEWCPVTTPGEVEMLATACFDSTACLWNTVTGECLRVFAEHSQHVYTLAFSPEGTMLATGGGGGFMHVYDTKTMERRWSWYNGDRSGVFEIKWKRWDKKTTMIAIALERQAVAVIDPSKVRALAWSG